MSLRQGLFLNIGFVTGPLISMLQRSAPPDFKGTSRIAAACKACHQPYRQK